MSQRHSHNSLAKCIRNLKIEQERNTWLLDIFYTRLSLSWKGRRFLKKCGFKELYGDEF